MISRLVLEWAYSHGKLIDYATKTPGRLQVVTANEALRRACHEAQVPVFDGDVTSRDSLTEVTAADVTLVAPATNQQLVRSLGVARTVFPETTITAIAPSADSRDPDIDRYADHVRGARSIVAEHTIERAVSPRTLRGTRVRSVMAAIDGELAVYMHDNPDPDAIASAVALVTLAKRVGLDAAAYYWGEITHQSNRAFVNLLDLDFERLDPGDPPPDSGGVALVDHSRPGINDSLPADTAIDMIFDHHTPSGPLEARFVDLRESIGATSSMLFEYLTQFSVPIDRTLATALIYGIRTDTNDFSRQVSPADFAAVRDLWSGADHSILEQIENPGISGDTMRAIASAIVSRKRNGPVVTAFMADPGGRDTLAQAADLLLQLDGVNVTVVYGVDDGTVHTSARARLPGSQVDLSLVLRDAYGQIGTAGGHEQMAGATIPIGMLSLDGTQTDEDEWTSVRAVLDDRFFDALTTHARTTFTELP